MNQAKSIALWPHPKSHEHPEASQSKVAEEDKTGSLGVEAVNQGPGKFMRTLKLKNNKHEYTLLEESAKLTFRMYQITNTRTKLPQVCEMQKLAANPALTQ